jgi:hypothetical protein
VLFAFDHAGTGDEEEIAGADADVADLERSGQWLVLSGRKMQNLFVLEY